MVAVWDTDPSLVPLRVGLVFGFLGYLRISNLAPPTAQSFDSARHSSWADVIQCKPGFLLDIKWTKTLQTQRGVTPIPLAALQDDRIYPVATWNFYNHMLPWVVSNSTTPLLLTTALLSAFRPESLWSTSRNTALGNPRQSTVTCCSTRPSRPQWVKRFKLLCFILAPQQGPNMARLGPASLLPLHKLPCFIFRAASSGLDKAHIQFVTTGLGKALIQSVITGLGRLSHISSLQAKLSYNLSSLSSPSALNIYVIPHHGFTTRHFWPQQGSLATALCNNLPSCLTTSSSAQPPLSSMSVSSQRRHVRPSGRQVTSVQPSAQQPGFSLSSRSS